MSAKFPRDFWESTQNRVEFIASDSVQNDIPFTAVKIFLFDKDKILLTKVPRGWDIPTGHVEQGESLEQAVKRETMEETGVAANKVKFIGYLKSTKIKENEKNKKYPLVSAIGVFLCKDFVVCDFNNPSHEATERCFCDIDKVKKISHYWPDLMEAVMRYALK